MYVYSKSVLPAYLLEIVYIFIEKIILIKTGGFSLHKSNFLSLIIQTTLQISKL